MNIDNEHNDIMSCTHYVHNHYVHYDNVHDMNNYLANNLLKKSGVQCIHTAYSSMYNFEKENEMHCHLVPVILISIVTIGNTNN